MLSERNLKDINKENEHTNYFININIKNRNENKIINKSNEPIDIGKKSSPRIYKKKLDPKNRQFIYQRENKVINKNDLYNKDIVSSKQNEFKKEIRDIYNEQRKNKKEYNKLDILEINVSKKKSFIKPPIIIDENKNNKEEEIIYSENINCNVSRKRYNLNIENNINDNNEKINLIPLKVKNKNGYNPIY